MAGDHTACRKQSCPYAGRVERSDVTALRRAVEAEFAGDPARREVARRHVEQAAEKGQPGVAAVVALNRMIEDKRAGRAAPAAGQADAAVEAEIKATIEHIIELDLLRAFSAVEARAGEVGWEAAVGEYRREHADAAEFVRKQGRLWMGPDRGWEQRDARTDFANRAAVAKVFGGGVGDGPR